MGPERATRAATWLVQHQPLNGLLSAGFAGGLQDGLATGAAIVPQQIRAWLSAAEIISASGDNLITADPRFAHLAALAARQAALTLRYGTLLSVATVLPDAAAKVAVGQRSGALAVDMESFSVGQVAATYALPFMPLRTIFDARHEVLSFPVPQLTTADGVVPPWRVLRYLAAHPQTLVHILPLWKKARRAGHCLAAWLYHFLTLLQQSQGGELRE
jgi:hypothetical protein